MHYDNLDGLFAGDKNRKNRHRELRHIIQFLHTWHKGEKIKREDVEFLLNFALSAAIENDREKRLEQQVEDRDTEVVKKIIERVSRSYTDCIIDTTHLSLLPKDSHE